MFIFTGSECNSFWVKLYKKCEYKHQYKGGVNENSVQVLDRGFIQTIHFRTSEITCFAAADVTSNLFFSAPVNAYIDQLQLLVNKTCT